MDMKSYRPDPIPALSCLKHPKVPAMGFAQVAGIEGLVLYCGECYDDRKIEVTVIPLVLQVEFQSYLDDLVELLQDDDALAEMLFDWEVNGTDHGVEDGS